MPEDEEYDDWVVEPPHDADEPNPGSDTDSGGSGESSNSSGGSSSSSSSSSSSNDSTTVVVTGDPGSEEGQTTVGQGDNLEEARTDAAANPDFDAAEGTQVDEIEEKIGSDGSSNESSTSVVVTGDPGSTEKQRTVGKGSTTLEARRNAAANPMFDAAEGDPVDALETAQKRGQGDGTPAEELIQKRRIQERQETTASQKRKDRAQKDRERQELQPFERAKELNLRAQARENTRRLGDNVEFAGSTGTATNRDLTATGQEDLGNLFNQGIAEVEDTLGINIRENINKATDLQPDQSGDNILIENPDVNNQAQFTPENPVLIENVGGEQVGGTDIPGESFLVSDVPTEEEKVARPVDLNAGQTALDTSNTLEDLTGNRQFAESVARVPGGGVQLVEGAANLPAFAETAVNNPKSTASATVQSLSNTVSSAGNRRALNTPEAFERQIEQDTLLLGALSFPVAGAASGGTVTGVTDSAGITTAARRASGIDDLKRAARGTNDVLGNRFTRADFKSDDAFQVDGDFGTIPDPDSGSASTGAGGELNRFYGESFEPETASAEQIITGNTPRTTAQRVNVLDPDTIEGVNPVTFTPEGGTRDVTPTQTRLEALQTRLSRAGESDRQTAQFEQQNLLDQGDSTGLQNILTNTRKGQQQLITEQRPGDVDTGVETDTQRLIDGDDRRQDVAENQIIRRTDETLEDVTGRPRQRIQRDVDTEVDTGISNVFASAQDTSQAQNQGFIPEQGQGLQPDTDQDVGQPLIEDQGVTSLGEGNGTSSTEEAFNRVFEEPEQRLRRDNNRRRDIGRDLDLDFRQRGEEDDQSNFMQSEEDLESDFKFRASVGAEILGVTAEEKPSRAKTQNPLNLRPVVQEENNKERKEDRLLDSFL